MSRRRIELSATQLIASTMAAVTGAIAASFLGVAGTIIGAAVASFASTAGTAVYRHYLGRTQEKVRTATVVSVARARAVRTQAHSQPHPETQPVSRRAAEPAPSRAAMPPGGGTGGLHLLPELAVGEDAAVGSGPGRAGSGDEHGSTSEPGRAGSPGALRRLASHGRRRWLAVAGLTVGVFLLSMAGITLIEAVTGKPLDAVIWHRPNSGTTVGNAVTGHTTPGPRPAPPSTPPAGPATAPASSSPSPSAASTSPTPAPSGSPTASPSPTSSGGPSTLPGIPAPTATPQSTSAAP